MDESATPAVISIPIVDIRNNSGTCLFHNKKMSLLRKFVILQIFYRDRQTVERCLFYGRFRLFEESRRSTTISKSVTFQIDNNVLK